MKHIKVYEVYSEMGDNPIFKVSFKSNTDLSNKKSNDTIDKPENDVLDNFAVGDNVSGKGAEDKEMHTGKVSRIEQDSKGENIAIYIEEDGQTVQLMVSTVTMVEEVGNIKIQDISMFNTNRMDPDPDPGGSTFENIKTFQTFKKAL